jgi:penicillin-binding protein 1A
LKKALLLFAGWSLLASIFGFIAVLSGTYLYLNPSLPDVETLKEIELQVPLRIFSADGKLIGEFGEKRRDPITFDEVPQTLIDAILSAEDDGFYSHQGVDITGLLRAVSQLALSGSIQSGGSTITMQVARNFFLTRNQTFSRKFNEILLAIKIEQELSKEEILTLYLNKIYLGNRAYGVKAASQVYYGKPVNELSTAQIAMISGLPKAPSTFNPIINPSRALVRRNWIIGRMLSLGKIDQTEHDAAIEEPVSASYHGQKLDLYAPYVAEMARDTALSLFGESAYTSGYNIFTTVDSRLQAAGQQAIVNGLLAYTQRHGYRGPERRLDLSMLTALPASNGENNNTDSNNTGQEKTVAIPNKQPPWGVGNVNLLPWITELKQTPNYGDLHAAAVISIEKKAFTAILASGEAITINWENGLSKTRAYVNENFSSPPSNTASKIVKLGDIVRVIPQEDGQWQFSQVPKVQGALTALDPNNGAIKTIVGGFDFNHSSFNRAYQAKRLPGSNFKPFVYSIALDNQLTAASIFNDAPIVVEEWRPENSGGKFYGPTRLRKALYLSRNLVSIRLLRTIGIETAVNGLSRFGIEKDTLAKDLSIALGTHVMTPLEVATGYTVFANNGYKVNPFIIDRITDSHNNVIFQESPLTVTQKTNSTSESTDFMTVKSAIDITNQQVFHHGLPTPNPEDIGVKINKNIPAAPQVMDERVAYIMNSILRDVVERGTAKKAKRLQRKDIGGKTGTTNGPTDAWFSGFNQHLVATAWVGFDNNSKIGKREYGGTAALPIWMEFMKTALENTPDTLPPQPNGIVTVRIDPDTGDITTPDNPHGIDEIFLEENVPESIANTTESGTEDNVIPEDIF